MAMIRVFPDAETLSAGSGQFVGGLLRESLGKSGRGTFVLAGGNTPRLLYRWLAESVTDRPIWEKVHLFWGDERCVPPDHPDSNFRMVREELLQKVDVPVENIHRIHGELPPGEGAAAYEEEIRSYFRSSPEDPPVFDFVLLGLGADGHVASIFPGSSTDAKRIAVPVCRSDVNRVSLTLPVINRARHVLILVSGSSKAAMVRHVLEEKGEPLPASEVRPHPGSLYWFMDSEAAALIREGRQ